MSGYRGHNRRTSDGGPQGFQRSYASQFREQDSSFNSYEHLQGLPRGDAALTMLRKVASMVKPVMRKRGWHVNILAEFLPPEQNLLGLNINRGNKICIRLRYHYNPDLFLPIEQVIDTMLHELSHIIWGDHDANFHRLWDELRDELETLIRKGYTGEGFLSEGKRLGGGHVPPPHEMRRLARVSAENRRKQNQLSKGSGQKLGGTPLHQQGRDVRSVIVDQVRRRNSSAISNGCGANRRDAVQLSDQSGRSTFKTKAEEDDANNRAIAQALYELMEEEETKKLNGTFSEKPTDGGLAWDPEEGLYDPTKERLPELNGGSSYHPTEEEQMEWALQESMRSTPTSQNLFQQPSSNNTSTSTPPTIPLESKPSPVSAASTSQPRSPFESPISPLSTQTSIHSTSVRRRPAPSSNSTSTPASVIDLTTTTTAPAHTSSSSTPTTQPTTPLIDLSPPFDPSATPPNEWTCEICTCINPLQFLSCDACGTERPQRIGIGNRGPRTIKAKPKVAVKMDGMGSVGGGGGGGGGDGSLGWVCRCGAFMEHKWWTCSACGRMKESS